MSKRVQKRFNKLGIITKNQLSIYTEDLLRSCFLYCVEYKYVDESVLGFDDFCADLKKYIKYSHSADYFGVMSFDEFKKGYDNV